MMTGKGDPAGITVRHRSGSSISPTAPAEHYQVNAIGPAYNFNPCSARGPVLKVHRILPHTLEIVYVRDDA